MQDDVSTELERPLERRRQKRVVDDEQRSGVVRQARTAPGAPPAAANAYWGIYEETYVRTGTGWKFKSVRGVLTLPQSA